MIKSVFFMFNLFVSLNQLFLKTLSVSSWIVSSNGTFVNREETSYDTSISSAVMLVWRIFSANLSGSEMVLLLTGML